MTDATDYSTEVQKQQLRQSDAAEQIANLLLEVGLFIALRDHLISYALKPP